MGPGWANADDGAIAACTDEPLIDAPNNWKLTLDADEVEALNAVTRYVPPVDENSLHITSALDVSSMCWPTASVRGVATRRFAVVSAVSPFTTTPTGTGPVGLQGSAVVAGTVNVTVVVVLDVTGVDTPLMTTSFSDGTAE